MTRRVALITECVRRMGPTLWAPAAVIIGLELLRLLDADARDLLDMATPAKITAVAMTAAWFLAIVAGNHLQTREITRLPVTRRDLWVCHWWLAVVGPGVMTGAAAAIGSAWINGASPQLFTARDVLLPAFCAAVWGSMFLVQRPQWLTLAMGWIDRLPPRSTSRRLVGYALVIWVLAYFIGGFALPFWIAPLVMQAAAAPTAFSYAIAIGVAVLAVANYFHTPPIKERVPVVRAVPPTAPNATPKFEPVSERLTGLRGMYWRELRRHLTLFGIGMTLMVGFWFLFAATDETLMAFLRAYWLLPFSGPGSRPPIQFIIILVAGSPQGSDVRREIRRLRTLPFSSRSLRNALMLRTMIGPLVLWSALLLMHFATLRTAPVSWRLDLLLLGLGVWALMHAAGLAIAGQRAVQTAVFAALFLAGVLLTTFLRDARPNMALTGAVLLASAWWLADWAIRQQSRLYAKYNGPVAETRFS